MSDSYIFTSEAVTEGHPDKLCDRISDAIVDRVLHADPTAHVVAETAVAKGIVFIAARFSGPRDVDIPKQARKMIRRAGYTREDFNAHTASIMTSLTPMDEPPAPLFDDDDEKMVSEYLARQPATMFGFACRQTPTLMPLPVWLANRLTQRLSVVRQEDRLPYLAPDGKVQVSVKYRNRVPESLESITVIAATLPDAPEDLNSVHDDVVREVVEPVLAGSPVGLEEAARVIVNPGGPYEIGGPYRHSGMTGRKTAGDLYGEYARQSSSALSGKDPSRIDRIGAYAARYAAKNIVAAGLADEAEVQVSYAMGRAEPVGLRVQTFNTGRMDDGALADRLAEFMDFRVGAIVRRFALRARFRDEKIFFTPLAAYGHVGRDDLDLPWEETDLAELLA